MITMKVCYFMWASITPTISDSLPNRSELFAALRHFHDATIEASCIEYRASERKRWMKWFPSLGLSYNLQGQPRPTIAYGLGQVYTNINDKAVKAAKIESIRKLGALAYQQDSINLEILLKKVAILRGGLEYAEATAKVDDQLWELTKQKYQANEIEPTVYLAALRQQTQRAEEDRKKREEYEILQLEVLKLARF